MIAMNFFFEVKYKNGKVQNVKIALSTSSIDAAVQELIRQCGDVTYKLLSQSPK
jgi:uncharacterized protein YdgA (DUF945 family)